MNEQKAIKVARHWLRNSIIMSAGGDLCNTPKTAIEHICISVLDNELDVTSISELGDLLKPDPKTIRESCVRDGALRLIEKVSVYMPLNNQPLDRP